MKMRLKYFFTVLAMVALTGASVLALPPIGPPTAELAKGQWSAGYNFTYSVQDLDKTNGKWSEVGYVDGALDYMDSGLWKLEITDMKTQRHYGTVGYGLADWWEVFISLGVADVKGEFEGSDEEGTFWEGGLNFDNDFAWGWGTKVTFARQEGVDWGVTVQMNFLDTSWSGSGSDSENGYIESWKQNLDLQVWDLVVAVGPTVDMGGWKLYGGPFWYYLDGDYDYKENGVWEEVDVESGTWLYKETADLEEDSSFGGYIGAMCGLAENYAMTIDFSFTGDGWGLGTGVAYRF